ncbi:hypothetical protein FisN_20Lh261 [Fistulifera solaris]|uniref:Uncharacterized protein n=1 Tax=Fistulifera solaris TaxID=1519565 RepID=A0A1Z5KSG8_FISSO|nr:hypothetical protein FisN_20Lh261 [Fistulifera solaris]|eukprot:GAX28941.1 hypothetical protein FisN_20Lh261 [Fistulifera solaris]
MEGENSGGFMHHDRRSMLKGNRQASHTSVSSDDSAPVSLTELKSRGYNSGRQHSLRGLSNNPSARWLFRAIFEKGSKKSVIENASVTQTFYPRNEGSSTTDQVASVSTTESSSPRDSLSKYPKRIVKEFISDREMPVRELSFCPRQVSFHSRKSVSMKKDRMLKNCDEDSILAESIDFLLSGTSTKHLNISDDDTLADNINYVLSRSTTRLSPGHGILHDKELAAKINSVLCASNGGYQASERIATRCSQHDQTFELPPVKAQRSVFVDFSRRVHQPQDSAFDSQGLVDSGIQNSLLDASAASTSSSAPPVLDKGFEPATPCFSFKSPRRAKNAASSPATTTPEGQVVESKLGSDFVPTTPCFAPKSRIRPKNEALSPIATPLVARVVAAAKKDDLHNMSQDAFREMVLQSSPLYSLPENHKQNSIPSFICFREDARTIGCMGTPARAIEQFARAQDLLSRIENNDCAEGLTALQKQVEALETEVLFSTAPWPVEPLKRCDSDISSLGDDEDSYGEDDSSCE